MQRLGPWRLEEELGRGGMGAVFLARRAEGGEPVALKVLLGGRLQDDAQRRRFRREAEALLRLRHPAIVRVLEVGEAEGTPFLALEYVRGRSLQERLDRQGALPPREAVALAGQLAEALADAHAQGLLHRDVKPANVLLDERGRARLSDFGLVRFLDPDPQGTVLTLTGQFLGSPGYWAPEQARGELSALGPATDVYGLGATLHAALTGEPPFESHSLAEAIEAHAARRRPEPPSRRGAPTDPALDALVLRCLAPEPADRFASAGELRDALAAWLEGRTWPAQRAVPRRAALAAGTLLGGALALAGALVVGRRPGAVPAPRTGEDAARAAPVPEDEAARCYARGLARIADRDPAGARLELERAVALRPGFARAWADLGGCLTILNREPAREALDRALELAPDDPYVWEYRGSAELQFGDASAAIPFLRRWTALTPKAPAAWSQLGRAQEAAGDLDGAEASLTRQVELDPELPASWLQRAGLRRNREDLAGSLADLTRYLALAPGDAEGWRERGQVNRDLNHLEEARADLDRSLALRPDDAGTLHIRALVLVRCQELTLAREDFLRAAALSPSDPVLLKNLGLCQAQLGNWGAAREAYERAIKLSPDDWDLWAQAAEAYRKLGLASRERGALKRALQRAPAGHPLRGRLGPRLAELESPPAPTDPPATGAAPAWATPPPPSSARSLARAEEACRQRPQDPRAWTELGLARLDAGETEQALSDLRHALELDPDDAQSVLGLGVAQLRTNALAEARASLDRALELDPGLGPAWFNRGLLRGNTGDARGGVADLTRCLAIDPRALPFFWRANFLRALGEEDAALRDLDEAIRLDPDVAQAYYNRAGVRAGRGDFVGCLADLDQLVRLRPDDPEIRHKRGTLRLRRGDPRGALEDLRYSLERLSPDPKTVGELRAMIAEAEAALPR